MNKFIIKKKYKKFSKAFTLIELLVVIAIIGILSSVVLASLESARSRGRDSQRIQSIRQVMLALEMYYQDNGRYPFSGHYPQICHDGGWQNPLQVLVSDGHLPALPLDNRNTTPFCFSYTGPNATNSDFRCNGEARTNFEYSIHFSLENETEIFYRVTSGETNKTHGTNCVLGPRKNLPGTGTGSGTGTGTGVGTGT